MHVSCASRRLRRLLQGAVLLAAILTAASAQAGIRSERLLAAILKHTPDSTLVPAGEQLKHAEAAAEDIPGATVFWGVGSSMAPLYSTHTAVVVAPVKYDDLQKGMTVVYLNRHGRMVAHSLTGDLPKGWIAQGVNNEKEDDDLVTAENLLGVVVQAYAEIQSEYRLALTKQLLVKGVWSATNS